MLQSVLCHIVSKNYSHTLLCMLLSSFFLAIQPLQGNAESLSLATQNVLPDIGQLSAPSSTSSYACNNQEMTAILKSTINTNNLILTPEYNINSGLRLSGSLASKVSDNFAVGIVPTLSLGKQELIINAGVGVTNNQRLILTVSQLRQKLDFSSLSGVSTENVIQHSGAISYQYLFPNSHLRQVNINGYISETKSSVIAEQTYFINTASLLTLWDDSQNIAGTSMARIQGQLMINPIPSASLKVDLSGQSLGYKNLTGSQYITRVTGHINWNQSLNKNLNFNIGFKSMASQDKYSFGISHKDKGRQKIGLNFVSVVGHGNTTNDKQIQLSYRYNFGSRYLSVKSPSHENIHRSTWSISLQDAVVNRPTFMPRYVVAY